MTTTATETPLLVRAGVDRFVAFLETGATDGLFAPDVLADITLPHWRVQAQGADEVVASKTKLDPPAGRVRIEKVQAGANGYTIKVEERWDDGGQRWYCREAFVCDLDQEGRIGRAVINSGAVMFHGVTDDTLARACERLGDTERAAALREKALETYRRIGATWWRERLEAAAGFAPPAPRTGPMTLRPGPAGVWLVGRGDDETAIPARRGLEHLHALLFRPGEEVSALHLAGGETVVQAGLGEIVDAQALAAYRRRLAEIDSELDDADVSGDARNGARLAAERDALLAEVSAATGLGGRPRMTGSSAERARVAVRKAIATALDAIHGADPVVARHLTSHVRTELWCCDKPDPDAPVEWRS